jgi:Terpene cyclase DEP1
MQWLYLAVAILGAALPLSQLVPFLAANGFDVPLLFRQLFETHAAAFFGLDVVVSSVALWLFVFSEGRRLRMKHLWLYVVCNLAVGVSLALPLFLFFRERRLRPAAADRSTAARNVSSRNRIRL